MIKRLVAWLLKILNRLRFDKKPNRRPEEDLIPEMRALPLSCRPLVVDGLLDSHQHIALTTPSRITLVLAGAGAGKTEVLTKRVELLNRYLGVSIEKMMILAFNDAAARVLSTRVGDHVGIPTEKLFKKNIRTIHSLAKEVCSKRQGTIPIASEESELRNIVKENLRAIREGPSGARYIDNVVELFGDYPRVQSRVFDRKKKSQSRSIACSDGTHVRSKRERAIVEELTRRGIRYIYEPAVTWADRYFQPDFYLPDYDVYIEYWGMHDHEDAALREKYRRDQLKKKEAFKRFNFRLIDLYPSSKAHPTDPILFLGKRLEGLSPNATEENVQAKLRNSFNAMEDQVIEVVLGVFAILTSYGKTITEMLPRRKSPLRQTLLFIAPICEAVEAQLREQGKKTFTMLLKDAAELLRTDPELLQEYRQRCRFVFVDEVQDLMPATRDFIRCLVGPEQSLYAIGDDYQSIYSFAGSDPSTLVKFDRYFEGHHEVRLFNNYRCHPKIVDVSNIVIRNNRVQIFKEVSGISRPGQNALDKPVKILTTDGSALDMNRLIDGLFEVIPPEEKLTVLSRYSEGKPAVAPWLAAFKAKGLGDRIEFFTIHRSKGLTADNVLIINCVEHPDEKFGFPAGDGIQSVKDEVLNLCRGPEFRLAEEETRLFYVALTRAKKRVFVQTVKGKESRFTTPKFLPRALVDA